MKTKNKALIVPLQWDSVPISQAEIKWTEKICSTENLVTGLEIVQHDFMG